MGCKAENIYGAGNGFYVYPLSADYFEETGTEYHFTPGTVINSVVIKFLDNIIPQFKYMPLKSGDGLGGFGYYDDQGNSIGSSSLFAGGNVNLDLRGDTVVTLSTPITLTVPSGVTTNYIVIKKLGHGNIASSGGGINYTFETDHFTTAASSTSFVHGIGVQDSNTGQTVLGTFNEKDTTKAFIIGNGYINNIRGQGDPEYTYSNAMSIDWYGNETLAGDLTINKSTTPIAVGERLLAIEERLLPDPPTADGT